MTDQTAPKPLVARAAEATVAGAANAWNAVVALAPSINGVVSALAIPLLCVALGIGGTVGYQKATSSLALPTAAPDLPKSLPTPVVSMENLDHALALQCGSLGGKLDTLLERTAPKGSMRKTSGKK